MELRFDVAIYLYEKALWTSLHSVSKICKPLVEHAQVNYVLSTVSLHTGVPYTGMLSHNISVQMVFTRKLLKSAQMVIVHWCHFV